MIKKDNGGDDEDGRMMDDDRTPESQKPRQRVSNALFLRQVHYWLKNFWILCITKYPDNMQSVRMNWKVSGQSKKCPDDLENLSG